MANLNKVMLIGRLTRDPEETKFNNGGKVAKFGFCVNERKKNNTTGEWEDAPVWIDVEAFNAGENGKLADIVMQYCVKGKEVFIEGRLRLDQWDDPNGGGKRSKLKVIAHTVQFLGPKDEGQGGGNFGQTRQQSNGGTRQQNQQPRNAAPPTSRRAANALPPFDDRYDDYNTHPPLGNEGEEVPF